MSVREYYCQHFAELNPDKQFHFATRIKNFFHSDEFQDYFASYIPSQDLASILRDNDYSRVNQLPLRQPYFEKYDRLYAIEAALFRVHHLLKEYNLDLRPQFTKLVSLDTLYQLADQLLADSGAIAVLSTWAVNTICLTEELFPRNKNVIRSLARQALALPDDATSPLLLIYLYTHIVLCDTDFYTRPVRELGLACNMLDRCAQIIDRHFTELTLDVRLEFLVCAALTGVTYPEIRTKVARECRQTLAQHPYLKDPRHPSYRHSLNAAEHCNVLYIMSGLDEE